MTVESVHRPVERIVESQNRFKASDGFQLFYRKWSLGGDTQRVVLGLHGIGGHSGNFAHIGEQLPADVPGTELYAVDRRGFGNSIEDGFQRGGVSSFKRYLRDIDEVAEFIRKENPGKKFYLFGKSLGCTHALRFAASHPDSVDGLILAAPPAITKVKIPRSLLLRGIFLVIFSPRTMIDTVRYLPEQDKQRDDILVALEDPLSSHGKFSIRYLVRVSPFIRTTLTNARSIRLPTLILQGDADHVVAPEGATTLLETLPASDKSLKTFSGATHGFYDALPPRQHSKYNDATRGQVYDCIADWLKTH